MGYNLLEDISHRFDIQMVLKSVLYDIMMESYRHYLCAVNRKESPCFVSVKISTSPETTEIHYFFMSSKSNIFYVI